MMESGHKTRSVFDRYNIVSEDDLKEAARRRWEHAQNQEGCERGSDEISAANFSIGHSLAQSWAQ
jgi:hypothetical protein